jgi:hypothetical protein
MVMHQPRFTPGERTPGTHCIAGWVGLRVGLDTEARGKILCLCWETNPGHLVHSQTLYYYTDAFNSSFLTTAKGLNLHQVGKADAISFLKY